MRRVAALVACALVSFVLLVGCAGGGRGEGGGGNASPDPAPIEEPAPEDATPKPADDAPEPGAGSTFSKGNDTDPSDGIVAFDADGDGVAEAYAIDFVDNGDEAPSLIVISLLENPEVSVVIDGAYEVREVMLVGNADGSESIYVRYAAGDCYGHDDDEWCDVSMVDGRLVVSNALFGC